MRIKSAAIILFLMSAISANAQDSLLGQFEQEVKAKNENVTSIQCQFIQIQEISVLADAVSKKGNFYFSKPGKMLLSFADGDYIKITEKWFEMKTGESLSSTRVSSNPMLKNLNSILSACVVGDFQQIAKGFKMNVEQADKEWIIAMIPQRGKAASGIAQIILHLDKKDMSLNVLKIEEKSGDYTMYKFFNKQFNKAIDSNLFKIKE